MTDDATAPRPPGRLSTGIDGLDEILGGGLPGGYAYLVEGDPGAGKTTLGLQFLLAGARRGEACLLISLSESAAELRDCATSHGWDLDGIEILEVFPEGGQLQPEEQYTMYHPSDVELNEAIKKILGALDRLEPSRVLIDSVTELRLLTETPLRYRRHILGLKQRFAADGITALFTDERFDTPGELHLHSIVHGVVTLYPEPAEYGPLRRRLQVTKVRGCSYREGFHDFAIRRGGLEVFPRLVAAAHRRPSSRESVPSGVADLDELLGGGLSRGTSTLFAGAAGTGKSSLASKFVHAATTRGERADVYLFDESVTTFLERASGLGMDLSDAEADDLLRLRQLDPAEMTPGEFAMTVRRGVEEDGVRMVVIDSLSGYLNAMPSERFLRLHLHELLSYLAQNEVSTLLVLAYHGLFEAPQGEMDASYLADTVILLRYFESRGRIRRAISVVKKRTGRHDRGIRELRFDDGIEVGRSLEDLEGVLTGWPRATLHQQPPQD